MIVIATGFIPLSPVSLVSTMVMWESSQWLGNYLLKELQESMDRYIGRRDLIEILLKTVLNTIQSINSVFISLMNIIVGTDLKQQGTPMTTFNISVMEKIIFFSYNQEIMKYSLLPSLPIHTLKKKLKTFHQITYCLKTE